MMRYVLHTLRWVALMAVVCGVSYILASYSVHGYVKW